MARRRRGHNEGSITQLADGRWQARVDLGYVAGKRKRKALYGKTRQEVAQKLTRALRDHQDGLPMANERQTVGGYLDQWLRAARPGLRSSAYAAYDLNVRRARPHIGQKALARLTPADLQDLYATLLARGPKGKPLSRRSVAQCHTVLHTALKQAVKWGLLARNPAEHATAPRPERQEMRALC